MLKYYIEEISALEFSERNQKIPKLVAHEKGIMIERGVLNSTITLEAIANFFTAEFIIRCDFLKNFIINHPDLLSDDHESDVVTDAKTLFQNAAFDEAETKLIDIFFH